MGRAILENKLESLKEQKTKLLQRLSEAKDRVGDLEAQLEDMNDRIADCFDDMIEETEP